ncbi:LysM peptidoglycan-binding domain-containing protein [uncultured Thomasclavelia sp.]|uniref:LysM peptidoglycan-binding domain-containing protein n=1 Tax=uncultured Thomasclavelia sp. TaxID=3025759 RepID=UPI00280BEABD|nr:LysM peptidoglycan-binding domain-containing protein [uncultured Thomasclavelia sp.]
MQKIFFEKLIDLNYQLNELVSLSVDESINYKIESVGVRAIGSLIVNGEYNESQKFNENIDLDILATFDKIVDQRDFNIKVEDFDYQIVDGNIKIKIEVGIHGVIDGEDRFVKDENIPEVNDDPIKEIESLIRDSDFETQEKEVVEEVASNQEPELELTKEVYEPAVMPNKEDTVSNNASKTTEITPKEKMVVNEINEQLQEKVYPTKSRPIFQDSEESVGTYYLYIVKDNDSYSSVAKRYDIDEKIIRDYNQDKVLEAGNVLIIPYVP